MIKFSEYVLKRDEELNEAGWGRALNSAISGIGRVPIQALRGGWNAGMGGAQALAGAGQTAAGIGKGFLGGGWDTAGRGLGNMAQGTGRAVSGLGQAALSPLSGLGRAYYANRPGGGGFLGMAPNTNNPGAWGGFKNWMGWQGKPTQTASDQPTQQQEPTQPPTGPNPQQQATQTTPSYLGQAWNSQQQAPTAQPATKPAMTPQQQAPAARPATKPAMTPQQQAFFQNNPGFNASGRANQPMNQQASTATQAWTPPASNPQQPTATSQYLDDQEARFNDPNSQYANWVNNVPGSSDPSASVWTAQMQRQQQASPLNLNQPSSSAINPQSSPVVAGSGFQMQPSNPSMPSQQPAQPQARPGQISPDVAGVLVNLPSLFQSRQRGLWDGQRQLTPGQATGALQDVKKAIGRETDPQHKQRLQNTYNYLLGIVSPKFSTNKGMS